MSTRAYDLFLVDWMSAHGFPSDAAGMLALLYSNETGAGSGSGQPICTPSTELAYQSFLTDMDMHCGNAEAAVTAAIGFAAAVEQSRKQSAAAAPIPVYFSVGAKPPSNLFPLSADGETPPPKMRVMCFRFSVFICFTCFYADSISVPWPPVGCHRCNASVGTIRRS